MVAVFVYLSTHAVYHVVTLYYYFMTALEHLYTGTHNAIVMHIQHACYLAH